MNNTTPTYLPVIDSLRGIASVMVCLFHYVCTTTGYVSNITILHLFSFGQYGVHVFFILSGVVIPLSMLKSNYTAANFFRYLLKRMARIEPPYLVSIVLYIIYTVVKHLFFEQTSVVEIPNAKAVVLHVGYLVPFVNNAKWFINTYWSLAVEFQYYLVLCAIYPLMVCSNFVVRNLCNLLFLTASLIFTNITLLPHWTPVFMLGIAYVGFINNKYSVVEFVVLQIISLALVLHLFSITVFLVCVATLVIIHFFKEFKTVVTLFLGRISYSLYLLHGITGGFVINYLSHNYKSTVQQIVVIMFGFVVALGCSYLFYLVIEKPSQALSKRILVHKKPSL
ncbi:MAG: acyltransferase [Bacteroidia bacterium]|nr:acyltransferase [Bacteroidia bacterium]